jgi:hypothetical protein
MPSLLPHPPLLAHTIYQALTFDAAVAEDGFSLAGTSAETADKADKWDGISEVILGREDWFAAWMDGEKKCALLDLIPYAPMLTYTSVAESQYHEIIGAADAWHIAEDEEEEDSGHTQELKSTSSARRIKALVEQVTGMFLIHLYYPLFVNTTQIAIPRCHTLLNVPGFLLPFSCLFWSIIMGGYSPLWMPSKRFHPHSCEPFRGRSALVWEGEMKAPLKLMHDDSPMASKVCRDYVKPGSVRDMSKPRWRGGVKNWYAK